MSNPFDKAAIILLVLTILGLDIVSRRDSFCPPDPDLRWTCQDCLFSYGEGHKVWTKGSVPVLPCPQCGWPVWELRMWTRRNNVWVPGPRLGADGKRQSRLVQDYDKAATRERKAPP
jgi:hypothetical protein